MDHTTFSNMNHMHDGHKHHMDHSNHHDTHVHHVHHVHHVLESTEMPGHDHHLHHHQSHDHESHIHQAFFNTGLNATALFENWILDTKGNIFLACLCTFILAIGYQGIKWFRQYLHVHYRGIRHSIKSKEHLVQTVLYITELLVSYLLMLIVMTYNVWVFVVTVLGITLGYFLLAWHKEFNPSCAEECHNKAANIDSKNMNYDHNPSSQELMPLDRPKRENDIENIEELDDATQLRPFKEEAMA
ncbi:hypothetical protein ACF0H5_004818 [Mactra antiquata]